MAKRKRKKPEDRLAEVIKILRPAYDYERIRILKSASVMLGISNFSHKKTCE